MHAFFLFSYVDAKTYLTTILAFYCLRTCITYTVLSFIYNRPHIYISLSSLFLIPAYEIISCENIGNIGIILWAITNIGVSAHPYENSPRTSCILHGGLICIAFCLSVCPSVCHWIIIHILESKGPPRIITD